MKKRCHSCLQIIEKEKSFCGACKIFFGTDAIIPISLQQIQSKLYLQVRKNSMQGMQDKVFLRLDNNQWTEVDWAKATHLLKLMPKRGNIYAYKNLRSTATNEHLSMQIAAQVFDIPSARSACVYLENDKNLVYITELFNKNPLIQGQEDLVQLAGLSPQGKYAFSYEKMFNIISRYSSNLAEDRIIFFKFVLLCIFLRNGDAHARNLSMLTQNNEVRLAPLYDVLNTQIHFNDDDGLACSLFENQEVKKYNNISKVKILDFALKIGIKAQEMNQLLDDFCQKSSTITELIKNSFMAQNAQVQYQKYLRNSIRMLCTPT